MNQEDATNLLISWLRKPNYERWSSYGYDIFLPNLIRAYLQSEHVNPNEHEQRLREMMPSFYAAAWDLCRRGILRPGVHSYQAQATESGNAGDGYSITPFGHEWVEETDKDNYVPTEPGRFAHMLKPFKDQFGPAFYERAQEAIKCYGAHAYLACCAMCGAASESILLTTAITKEGNEEEILKIYASANGRSKLENIIIGQAKDFLRQEYQRYTILIKYWRDESAHGKKSNINDNEAFTSLALLLRLAKFVHDNWDELVKS